MTRGRLLQSRGLPNVSIILAKEDEETVLLADYLTKVSTLVTDLCTRNMRETHRIVKIKFQI